MAFTTSVNDEDLARVYSDENLFEPCQREETRFWDDLQESKDHWPGGSGYFFEIVGATGHASGAVAEGGDWSPTRNQVGVQPSVTGAQIDSPVEVSEKFFNAAKGEGVLGPNADQRAIITATRDMYTHLQRLLVSGHGTGRLAIVDANTSASTQFVARLEEGAFQLHINDPIDFVDTDTGGTVQDSAIITDINYTTGLVTMDSTVTATAGWGVYHTGDYGVALPNGIRNIVDDGDFATTIFGVSRTAPSTYLNAYVNDGSGGLQDYSEELVAELLDQVTMRQDKIPTQLRCNKGIVREHQRVVVPDRVYTVTGKANPAYTAGANDEAFNFQYGEKLIPFRVDKYMPARELYALYMPGFRKHTLRKPGWLRREGGQIFIPKPAAGGGTYTTSWIANMMIDINITHRCLNSNGKLSNIRDRSLARDTV
jgi:hypothetical protein